MLQKCLKAYLSKSAQAQAQAQMLYLKKCLKAPSSTLKNVLKALLSTSTLVLDPCLQFTLYAKLEFAKRDFAGYYLL